MNRRGFLTASACLTATGYAGAAQERPDDETAVRHMIER
jgi:hypothetical protein